MQNLFRKITVQQFLIVFAVATMLFDIFVLKFFFSGLLGAVALYVVTRKFYLKLVEQRRWKKNPAIVFVFTLLIISFGIPMWILIDILVPKVNELISDRAAIIEKIHSVRVFLENNPYLQRFDFTISNEQMVQIVNRIISYIPSTINAVGQIFANVFVALFILYFMLLNTRKMEENFRAMLPLSTASTNYFIKQNAALIRSNAYGIPILAFAQGIIAIVGYMIFGVNNAIFWGLLTGAASIIPVVGTMIIWVPICIYQIATGDVNNGLMLGLYCLVLVGSIDNVLRFTVLKKMADIHPLITVFGVLLGLQLFGVMGLVFGPVLLSLPGILYKVFKIEKAQNVSELKVAQNDENQENSQKILPENPPV